jgi:hypothetical protein
MNRTHEWTVQGKSPTGYTETIVIRAHVDAPDPSRQLEAGIIDHL